MNYPHLGKIDSRTIPDSKTEIRAFIGTRNDLIRLPHLLEHYRVLGVDRFFFMDNGSDDGAREYLVSQPDCHSFHTEGSHFANNVAPPNWTNTLLNVFGQGHWCVVVDSDELLVFPECERTNLRLLIQYLEMSGAEALTASMIDMYGDGPIADARYDGQLSMLDACPYFDPDPGWYKEPDDLFPPIRMFGGVRERALWPPRFKHTYPPCLTKVPFVKWKRGMQYFVAQHTISKTIFSEIAAALLHFKFLDGFADSTKLSVQENKDLYEKGLDERKAYIEALQKNPSLTLKTKNSEKYRSTEQLTSLNWMKSSVEYMNYINISIRIEN